MNTTYRYHQVSRKKCKHPTVTSSEPRGYTGSVAQYPHTMENRRAHGGIVVVESCKDCGATRRVASNGLAREFSTWGHDR